MEQKINFFHPNSSKVEEITKFAQMETDLNEQKKKNYTLERINLDLKNENGRKTDQIITLKKINTLLHYDYEQHRIELRKDSEISELRNKMSQKEMDIVSMENVIIKLEMENMQKDEQIWTLRKIVDLLHYYNRQLVSEIENK